MDIGIREILGFGLVILLVFFVIHLQDQRETKKRSSPALEQKLEETAELAKETDPEMAVILYTLLGVYLSDDRETMSFLMEGFAEIAKNQQAKLQEKIKRSIN